MDFVALRYRVTSNPSVGAIEQVRGQQQAMELTQFGSLGRVALSFRALLVDRFYETNRF
jgi:hypothetical protein